MLTYFQSNDDILSTTFGSFAKKFGIFSILSKCGAKKIRGVPVSRVFAYLFSIAFKNISIYNDQKSNNPDTIGKDCVHRFLQSPKIDWNKLTSALAAESSRSNLSRFTRSPLFPIGVVLFWTTVLSNGTARTRLSCSPAVMIMPNTYTSRVFVCLPSAIQTGNRLLFP